MNGVTTQRQFDFDKANKLENQTSEFGVKYKYNNAGDVIKKTHQKTGIVEDFTYNSLGQLLEVEASNGKVIQYAYDALGERISKDAIIDIAQSKDNEFLAFIKEDTYNKDYDVELLKQTTTQQLRNLRNNMREYKETHSDGKTCPISDVERTGIVLSLSD